MLCMSGVHHGFCNSVHVMSSGFCNRLIICLSNISSGRKFFYNRAVVIRVLNCFVNVVNVSVIQSLCQDTVNWSL